MKWSTVFLLIFSSLGATCVYAIPHKAAPPNVRLSRLTGDAGAEFIVDGKTVVAQKGQQIGVWTLVEIIPESIQAGSEYAVLEDYTQLNGHLILVDTRGVQMDLPKSAEPTSTDRSKLYLGHSQEEILNSAKDLLGNEILAKPGDPTYDEVAGVFEPIRKMQTYSFVGTRDTIDKIGFTYGGRSPNFDPDPYYPPINQIRDQGKVLDGLVGGYLPVLRFVYPDDDGNWTEMITFAPLRISNGNEKIQPVWYRVSRIENGSLRWAKYVDSYHPRREPITIQNFSTRIWSLYKMDGSACCSKE